MTETEKWINESLKSLPHLCAEIRRLSNENDALRAQQEAEKNEPLTLDELREMGGEPVWVVCLTDTDLSCWGFHDEDGVCGYCANFSDDDYGKTWLAYRRKPEEGERMSEWISVKDRLPKRNQNVLCFSANRAVLFATDWLDWPDGTVSFYVPDLDRYIWCTNWMPLPEPPEES